MHVLNKFVIPIPVSNPAYSDLQMMQQDIEILPVELGDKKMVLVVIEDKTAKVHLQNTLMTMAAKFEKNNVMDMLTELFNRRYLWLHLEIKLAEARRESSNVIC